MATDIFAAMHPANDPRRRWDGSPARSHHPRALRVAQSSPSRLLRTAQPGSCRYCGNRIEWYPRTDHERPVALHPRELAAAAVPARCRWHVGAGIAHRAGDGSIWCRIPHHLLCPAWESALTLPPRLAELRRQLALHTRRLIDTGAFTAPPVDAQPSPAECRPVVQILGIRYLARLPVEGIRCVSQTRRRTRCRHPVLAPGPAGTWTLQPATATTVRGQLALPDTVMALYDLTPLPYAEQLRWRTQRCPGHAAVSDAADLALADWEPFDPLAHHEHIRTRLPNEPRHPGPCPLQ